MANSFIYYIKTKLVRLVFIILACIPKGKKQVMTNVFVYGILRGHKKCKHGKVRSYTMFDMGSFPGAVPGDEKDCVIGEVIEVDQRTITMFDQIEGHPHLYVRTDVEVELDDGTKEAAQMYVLADCHRADAKRLQPLRKGVGTVVKENEDREHSYR